MVKIQTKQNILWIYFKDKQVVSNQNQSTVATCTAFAEASELLASGSVHDNIKWSVIYSVFTSVFINLHFCVRKCGI